MPKAGYCKECKKYVWLKEDGSCQFGHAASSIDYAWEPEATYIGPHLKLLHTEVSKNQIITEAEGNNRGIAVTQNMVYVASKGISSGSFFGKKIKGYPIDKITSVDISRRLTVCELEIGLAGAIEHSTHGTFSSRASSENIIMFPKERYPLFKKVADKIIELKEGLKESKPGESIPDQIRKLSELKDAGIISEEEFEAKKRDLLSKM